MAGKSVELIRELVPAARRIGVLADESDPFAKAYVAKISASRAQRRHGDGDHHTRPGQPIERRIRDPDRQTRGRAPHPRKHRAQGNGSTWRSDIACRH